MKLFRRDTIFGQLIYNIILSIIIVLVVLELLTYFHTKKLLTDSNRAKNLSLVDEITNMLDFQDLALSILDTKLEPQIARYSNIIVEQYLTNPDSIEITDLSALRKKIGLDPAFADIYLINRNGVVINTTFKDDYNRNFFDFGEDHKKFLLNILSDGQFVSERFAIEATTKRLKKYSYQPTKDGKYILELGFYSNEADSIIKHIIGRLNAISGKHRNIVSVDLFIGHDSPFSLNNPKAIVHADHEPVLRSIFETGVGSQIEEKEHGNYYNYNYLYMDRRNTDLYKSSVIRIVEDKKADIGFLRTELLKNIILFSIALIAITIFLYKKIQLITNPIQKIVTNIDVLSESNFRNRVEVVGNNELTTLTMNFNTLLQQIETRNEEIQSQNAVIEKQTKNTSDIQEQLRVMKSKVKFNDQNLLNIERYIKKIQQALLPESQDFASLFPNSFIFHMPKAQVSGDFYWHKSLEGGDKILLAVADCSGHGIPGAIISILGVQSLQYAIGQRQIQSPAQILKSIDQSMNAILNTSDKNFYEGMDISLCLIDKPAEKITFAGAMRPVFVAHKEKLNIYEGSTHSVGKYISSTTKEFQDIEIPIQKGDRIFMFTDGYAMQFADIDKSRFTYNRFQQLVEGNLAHSLQQQKILLQKTLQSWMGNADQADDILILAIEV